MIDCLAKTKPSSLKYRTTKPRSRPSYPTISTDSSRRNILRWLQTTHTTDPKLCSSLDHTDDTFMAFSSILVWELVVGNPARMAESVANADGVWRDHASIAVGALPCVFREASHNVRAAAGLPSEGWCYTSAVLTRVELH